MSSNLIFFIPASWILLIPFVIFISSVTFFISLKIFMIEESVKIFKKYFLKVFLATFFSNLMCSVFIFLVGFLPFGYVIYEKNIFGNLFSLICLIISIILNVFLLEKIMFLNLKLNKKVKKYICLIISILSAPYILLIV